METRSIGSLHVSVVGLGCNNFGRRLDASATQLVVSAALEAGINFFDTADAYGGGQSESFLGPLLAPHRREIIIATKFGMAMEDQGKGASGAYIRRAVEASLRRLGTDYIDLYQIHQPDPSVPIAETLDMLNTLATEGKVREIGCSNFSVAQLREASEAVKPGAIRFESVQNEYSLLRREPEQDVLPECERIGIGFLPYFPLASGMLTGKYRKDQPAPEGTRITSGPNYAKWLTDANLSSVEALFDYAEAHKHTLLDLAFGWLLRWPSVSSVIAGATKPSQIQSNVSSAGWKLSAAEVTEVEAILATVKMS